MTDPLSARLQPNAQKEWNGVLMVKGHLIKILYQLAQASHNCSRQFTPWDSGGRSMQKYAGVEVHGH